MTPTHNKDVNREPLTFDYNGLPISWRRSGSGKPLVILHGWGSSSRVMAPIASHLSELRTTCLIDLPGHGHSPEPPVAWSIDDYAKMTAAFIEELGSDRVDLLVHSFGGRIALKLLAGYEAAKRIDKVLITGGAGMKPRRGLSYYYRKGLATTLKLPFKLLPPRLRSRGLNRLRQTRVWRSLGSSDYQNLSDVMRGTFVKAVTDHLDPLLPKIDHEILLIWGENDEATPLYQAERMERGLKNSALVVVEGAGHYAFLDKPKRFAAIATAFFNPKTGTSG